jgi:hypothetical protein
MRVRQRPPSVVARSTTLASVFLIVLSGCGAAGEDPPSVTPSDTEEVGNAEASSEEQEADSETPDAVVTPRPGMIDVEPVRIWYEYGSWDGELMYVTFRSQGAPCEVLDRIEIDEGETRVTVTLYQGRDPDLDRAEPCDGPWKALRVVLPPLERDYGPEEGAFVNGASLTDGP